MKALILVGGFGTRLRPLTLTCPKPLIEFANKPMIIHQIEALKEVGCTEVILAVNYRPEVMMQFLEQWSAKLDIKITCSKEEQPLGTAGPLALAREQLDDGSGEPFFVLNSDVICEYPLADLLAFHKQRGAEATILVTRVADPSQFGVVVADQEGRIQRFVEKPKEFVGDKINAGVYCLSPAVLKRIEPRPTSIEREVFPAIAAEGRLFSFVLEGYWMDVGKPKDFLQGQSLYLSSLERKDPGQLASGPSYLTHVIQAPSATVGGNCRIGPNVSIGDGVTVGDGVRLRDCVLMNNVKVERCACVLDSIIGWGSTVGPWARLEGSVLGDDVHCQGEVYVRDAVILPHKEVKESIYEHRIVL